MPTQVIMRFQQVAEYDFRFWLFSAEQSARTAVFTFDAQRLDAAGFGALD
jgi:hypothetical protein